MTGIRESERRWGMRGGWGWMVKELVPQGKGLGVFFLKMAVGLCFGESSQAAV